MYSRKCRSFSIFATFFFALSSSWQPYASSTFVSFRLNRTPNGWRLYDFWPKWKMCVAIVANVFFSLWFKSRFLVETMHFLDIHNGNDTVFFYFVCIRRRALTWAGLNESEWTNETIFWFSSIINAAVTLAFLLLRYKWQQQKKRCLNMENRLEKKMYKSYRASQYGHKHMPNFHYFLFYGISRPCISHPVHFPSKNKYRRSLIV